MTALYPPPFSACTTSTPTAIRPFLSAPTVRCRGRVGLIWSSPMGNIIGRSWISLLRTPTRTGSASCIAGGVPPWAAASQSTCAATTFVGVKSCTGNVANIADWDAFVTALVTRYKGQIQIYELWNEPQNAFTGTIRKWSCSRSTHTTLFAPSTHCDDSLALDVAWGYQYLDSYFAAGGTQDIDAIAFHLYPNTSNDIAKTVTTTATSTLRTVMASTVSPASPCGIPREAGATKAMAR